jgi:signal transduction histidine kinase
VFENLLRNSIEQGGEDVSIRSGPLEDGFYVEDDGPGIPADHRPRMFDHGFTTRPDGHGYGLSIAGAHGWDITVTSGEAGGARFKITASSSSTIRSVEIGGASGGSPAIHGRSE